MAIQLTSDPLGVAYWLRGDVVAASQAFLESVHTSLSAGNVYAALTFSCDLARLHVLQGQLHEAARTYHTALELATKQDGGILDTSLAQVGLGDLLREWNELERAVESLTQGLKLAERAGNRIALSYGYLSLVHVKLAQGEKQAAWQLFENLDQLVQHAKLTPFLSVVATCRVRLALIDGNSEVASEWEKGCGLSIEDELSHVREFEYLTLARVFVATGRYDSAMVLLRRIQQAAEGGKRIRSAIESLVLQVIALEAEGNISLAMKKLLRILAMAEQEGYVRIFVDEGEPIAKLLLKIVEAWQKGLCWLLGTSVLEMGGLHPHNLSHLSQHIAITKKDTCQEKR